MTLPMSQPAVAECEPLAPIPAWWSTFLFHVLNPRQVCMYLYLAMLTSTSASCHPTIEQIREDLSLYSTSMVFEALAALEDLNFIERERRLLPGSRAKRNVYRRPRCERTILRLLERGLIDGSLQATSRQGTPRPSESEQLVARGLASILDSHHPRYLAAPEGARTAVLAEILREILAERSTQA
jgi:hypothetical protein